MLIGVRSALLCQNWGPLPGLRPKIWDNQTHADPAYYGGQYDVENTPGTTHISVVGKDNDAVAITSTINTHFGAKLMTKHGIILNNQMDDFSSPGGCFWLGLDFLTGFSGGASGACSNATDHVARRALSRYCHAAAESCSFFFSRRQA